MPSLGRRGDATPTPREVRIRQAGRGKDKRCPRRFCSIPTRRSDETSGLKGGDTLSFGDSGRGRMQAAGHDDRSISLNNRSFVRSLVPYHGGHGELRNVAIDAQG